MSATPASTAPNGSTARKLRWGLAGCGWAARDFIAPALTASRNGDLVALLDPDPESLDLLLEVVPGAEPHADPRSFFASDLDAVYVATPNHLHRILTEAAAAAGKHVLCEKPMALTLGDAEAMVAACEWAGIVYATAFDQRFHAAHKRLRSLLEEGVLGEVCSARIQYACWLPPRWSPEGWPKEHDNWRADPYRAGSGALFDLAPHGLDLLQYLLNDEIQEIRALGQRRIFDYPVEDGAALVASFSRGALAVHQISYNMPETLPRRTLEIQGTDGMAIALDTMGQDAGGTLEFIDAADGARRPVEIPPDEDVSPFLNQVEAFADAVLHERPFPFSPARDLRTMRVLTEALRGVAASTPAVVGPAGEF